MAPGIRSKLTFSNVVSVLALFIAVGGGTAFALKGKNTVRSDDIAKGQVKNADIARNAVTAVKVKNGAIGGADVADGAIGAGELSPAIRPVRISYSRPIGTAAQETILDAGALRIQASCEDDGGRPHLSVLLTLSQPGTLDSFGAGNVGSTSAALEGTAPVPAGTPIALSDFTAPMGNRAGSGKAISYWLESQAGNLLIHVDASDVSDVCAVRGTLLPLG